MAVFGKDNEVAAGPPPRENKARSVGPCRGISMTTTNTPTGIQRPVAPECQYGGARAYTAPACPGRAAAAVPRAKERRCRLPSSGGSPPPCWCWPN
ncbi:hypothetical protein CATMQ487_26590 [Sphaerotilus microaerophilus]|uniref:Uncharacterized protein n=1 Tax=Sphaerotilus microaerophilus TaxID=2914710 RepID=A0ABN6PNU0_9BURK|nr:hypothetical protein CATMQ487_26590 [Sphaerotilus sp. FB-5]